MSLTAISLEHYLILASLLFVCGLLTILLKRNAIGILMGVELILNAANVNLVALNRFAQADIACVKISSCKFRRLVQDLMRFKLRNRRI